MPRRRLEKLEIICQSAPARCIPTAGAMPASLKSPDFSLAYVYTALPGFKFRPFKRFQIAYYIVYYMVGKQVTSDTDGILDAIKIIIDSPLSAPRFQLHLMTRISH